MNKILTTAAIILSVFLISSCNSGEKKPAGETAANDSNDSAAKEEYAHDHMEKSDSSGSMANETALLYLVIADTGLTYQPLLQKMLAMKNQYGMAIDSMDRYYDSKKNKIILPANHEDELYAGEYFPRRFPSTHLSVEYLETYKDDAGKNTMALVAGIFENEKSADSTLDVMRKSEKNAYKLKTEIYLGCAH